MHLVLFDRYTFSPAMVGIKLYWLAWARKFSSMATIVYFIFPPNTKQSLNWETRNILRIHNSITVLICSQPFLTETGPSNYETPSIITAQPRAWNSDIGWARFCFYDAWSSVIWGTNFNKGRTGEQTKMVW